MAGKQNFKDVQITTAQCSPNLYKKLYGLNFRQRGQMQRKLRYRRKANVPMLIFYIMDQENKVAAWAMVYLDYDREPTLQTYTRKIYRRRGLGKQLINYALEHFNSIRVLPHNKPSETFFEQFNHKKIYSDMYYLMR